jgi:hypothetical protein
MKSQDCSVGIVTVYWPDGLGSIPGGADFSLLLRPTLPPFQRVQWPVSPEIKQQKG